MTPKIKFILESKKGIKKQQKENFKVLYKGFLATKRIFFRFKNEFNFFIESSPCTCHNRAAALQRKIISK